MTRTVAAVEESPSPGDTEEVTRHSVRHVPRELYNRLSFAASWAKAHGETEATINALSIEGLELVVARVEAAYGKLPLPGAPVVAKTATRPSRTRA